MLRTQYKNSQFKLTVNEVEKVLSAATSFRNKMIIESLYYPALRREEVVNLDIRDIDFKRGRINILGKGNKLSPIPVSSIYPQYLNNLKFIIGKRLTGPVFLSNRNKKFSLSMINKIVAKIGKKSGVKNPNPRFNQLNPHLFRHTQARHLKNLKFPTEFIQHYLRHDSYKTTMDEYGTMSIDDCEKEANKLLINERK